MNMKKIILAATTFIMASTLSTGFAAPSQALDIQTDKLYLSKGQTNAIKFNKKGGKYTVVGLYLGKTSKTLGTWTAKKCDSSKSKMLTCKFKSSHHQNGFITFVANEDGSLQSSIKSKKSKLPPKTHIWRIAE